MWLNKRHNALEPGGHAAQLASPFIFLVRRARLSVTKCLLLGPGESGKSTIVKQMRLVYSSPYTPTELLSFREVVFSNLLQSAQSLLSSFSALKIRLPSDFKEEVKWLKEVNQTEEVVDPETGGLGSEAAEALGRLWEAQGTKEAMRRSAEFQLNDSAEYFFTHLARIASPSYLPTEGDVLRTRVRSIGVVEQTFEFENIGVLVFVIAISEYNQTLFEDSRQNRLDESLELWEMISASRWFRRTTFVLFLNKTDIFERKILSGFAPLAASIPNYRGPPENVPAAKAYMLDTLTALYKQHTPDRALFAHFTQATDRVSTQVVLGAVMTGVMTSTLQEMGLL
ncbi:guanine nucleotide-binding protein alpha subunit [Rhodotorula toruloides]|uniref:Guanine nucleotide-binding protein alpha subunit n=1 Tax=Rhodotorula toruloides TaxID=5286 RepID=A0A511KNC8_RHOTO|nr:guanine nucleotide-binding protein alpha subunit [Rhodotorula toruloides]